MCLSSLPFFGKAVSMIAQARNPAPGDGLFR